MLLMSIDWLANAFSITVYQLFSPNEIAVMQFLKRAPTEALSPRNAPSGWGTWFASCTSHPLVVPVGSAGFLRCEVTVLPSRSGEICGGMKTPVSPKTFAHGFQRPSADLV